MFKKNFDRPSQPRRDGEGGGGYNKKRFSGGSDRGGDRRERELFQAICDNCGRSCEVPFRPNGKKPVYCSNCFNAPRNEQGGNPDRGNSRETFAPRAERPSFSRELQNGNQDLEGLKRQMAAMNVKIDTMLKILENGSPAKVAAAVFTEEKPEEPKAPKAKSKTELQETIRKDLVKKRIAKKKAKK